MSVCQITQGGSGSSRIRTIPHGPLKKICNKCQPQLSAAQSICLKLLDISVKRYCKYRDKARKRLVVEFQ